MASATLQIEDTLLATKLYSPRPRRDLVRRVRLMERLSTTIAGALTLVVAPAGSGKTTVLADWLSGSLDSRWPLAWLSLDDGDNDLARFLRYLVAALQTLDARIGRSLPAGVRAPEPKVEALLTPLLNDLAALRDDVILVLDDYHVVDSPAVHQAMAFLLDHLPPRLHLVIATRIDPPLPLARLRARGQLAELRMADLRFTADEAAAFLAQTMELRLSAENVARIGACTEGWIAGLQLAALVLHGRDPEQVAQAIATATRGNRFILDYLADEVFNRQPDDVRRFLLRTAMIDRLSGPLCEAMSADSGAGDGQAMLERLEAANLFLVPLDDTRTWYRYHHLFAGFLRERLRREQPDLIPDLHRRAYRWLEQHGQAALAADHALAAEDYEEAARLIEIAIGPTIWQRGELRTLLRWLERLPREVARSRPRLCLDLAWVLLWSARVDAVEPRLRDAEEALDTVAQAAGAAPRAFGRAVRGEIAAIRAELARQRGESGAAIELARLALTDLPAEDRRVRGVTTGLLASALLWSGDAAAASRAFGDAVALSRTASTITLALIASGRLVFAQALQGRLHQAAATYRETLDLAAAYGVATSPAIGVAGVGMGEVLREWNDLEGAEQILQRSIAQCAQSGGMAEMALDGSLILTRVAQARGDLPGAFAALRQAEALGRDDHIAHRAERLAAAWTRLWLTSTPGDVAAAARWSVERAAAWQGDAPTGLLGLIERLTLARLRLMQGRHEDAVPLLRRLLTTAEAGGLIGYVIEILALQARASLEMGQEAQAMVALSRALALAEPEGYRRALLDEGRSMGALLRAAQARGVTPEYVSALLAAIGGEPATSHAPDVLVDPLSARERELLGLLAAGLSTLEIAAHLFITAGTVRNHLKSIFGKLDVHSRLQAVERARALNLL